MSRLPELSIEDAAADVAAVMRSQEQALGFVLNSTRVLGHCPGIVQAAAAMGDAIDNAGQIEPPLRYLLYARVAGLNGCPF